MLDENIELFKSFEEIHALYDLEPAKHQEDFNKEGEQVLEIIREYENRLCSYSEGGKYRAFSPRLAEKFQKLVRARFPKIDHVGIVVKKSEVSFKIEKLKFS
jgi:hypothetical protein